MMTWNPDNTVNRVTFTPSYFDGNAPFGNAGIIHWYAYRKVVGPTLSVADTEEDYVCLVLDQRLGDLECALDSGQFQAAVLTGCWAWRSSYCAGLR
jgi:hypothetical protein